jgi:hypothetical protein
MLAVGRRVASERLRTNFIGNPGLRHDTGCFQRTVILGETKALIRFAIAVNIQSRSFGFNFVEPSGDTFGMTRL